MIFFFSSRHSSTTERSAQVLGRSSGDPAGNRYRVSRCLPAKSGDRTQLQQRAGKIGQSNHQQK